MKKAIMAVKAISLHNQSGTITLSVKGEASSGGWTKVRLEPAGDPEAGIYPFNLVGEAPGGFAIQMLSPVESQALEMETPKGFAGVKVIAKSNEMVAKA